MSDDAPRTLPIQPGGELLKFLAIGRLAVNAQGDLLPDKHRLVAHNFNKKDDPDPEWTKTIKSHVKAVMKRAGHKLTPGKRIRLKDDNSLYEVHILTDEQDGDKNKVLVFFGQLAYEHEDTQSIALAYLSEFSPVFLICLVCVLFCCVPLFLPPAITAINFPKYHSVPALLRDLKGGFYQTVDGRTLWNGGSVQRACQPYFQRIMTQSV